MMNAARRIKLLALSLALLCCCFVQSFGQSSVAAKYIAAHRQKAIYIMEKTGIPASVILGVSMVESAMGRSRNCKMLNNYFGVKGKNKLHKSKTKVRSAYKQYKNAESSFMDFAGIVQRKKFYPKLKGNRNYKLWLKSMNAHGYAEAAGRWQKDVTSMIEKYDLNELDNEPFMVDDDSSPLWGIDSTMVNLEQP